MKKNINKELEVSQTNKTSKRWRIIAGIIIVIAVVFGYLIVKDLKEERVLREEIATYLEKDITKDEFLVEIKTSGNYAIIEQEIKTYFKELSDTVKRINILEEDETFSNILTTQNFEEDGPDFAKSMAKLVEVRTEVSEVINKLSEMCSEEYILSLIESYDLDSYYQNLYKDLMYTEEDLTEIQKTRDEMITVGEKFDIFLEDCEAIINFLKENNGKWIIEKDTIVFQNDTLLSEYQKLTEQLLEDSQF